MSENPYGVIRPARGAALEQGRAYHDIPGVDGPTHRKSSQKRGDQIASFINVHGKTGLDLGCSLGGVSFALAEHGAVMHGYDADESAIYLGQEHAKAHRLPVILSVADLTKEDVFDEVVIEDMYDFCIWLANWMWIATDAGYDYACRMLRMVSERIPVLVFETAQHGGSQAGNHGVNSPDDVVALLRSHTIYKEITNLGPSVDGWMGRSVFVCQ
jgi:SAM-dependent methyltransferase